MRNRQYLFAAIMRLLLVCAVSLTARADFTDVYALRGTPSQNLYFLNIAGGNDSVVYSGYPGASGATLAMRPSDGQLFYVENQTNGVLYRWNPLTPATAPVAIGSGIGASIPASLRLCFGQNGTLYYMTVDDIYTINTTTGVATLFSTITGTGVGGDMAFGSDGTFYLANNAQLLTAPIGGGAATLVGNITGMTGNLVGLAFDPNDRMIILASDASSSYYVLNPTTAAATFLATATAGTTTGDLASGPSQRISGRVFEDVNYGGGAGRSRAASSGVGRPGARVELYNAVGNFVTFTTTDASGDYRFAGVSGQNYTVRVVNSTVTSSRTGYVPGLLPVQTYRTTASSGTAVAVTDRVGGETPTLADAGNGSTTLAALNTGTTTAQSIAPITVGTIVGGTIPNVDFGFNFDTIVNTNDSGQGSLRRFIINANALGNGGLAQSGQTLGREVSIFMISNGTAVPGLRAGLANQLTSGVARIVPTTQLPTITDANTTIDGSTQTANVGNTNAGSLGTGGAVGVDNVALGQVAAPEVEIRDAGSLANGLVIQAAGGTVRGVSILGFGGANGEGAVRFAAGGTGGLVENNFLGPAATSFADPGAALRNYEGATAESATGGTIQNNLISFNGRRGIFLQISSTGWTVTGNELRDNGLADADGDGLAIDTSSATVTGNLVVGSSSQGLVVTNASGSVFTNNTVNGNGVGIPGSVLQTAGITIRSTGSGSTFDRNIVRANYGAGLAVNNGGATIRMTRNSFFDNGTITARNGGGATGQIGIDLNSASEDANLGTTPFYTVNDNGDGDSGGNGLLNFPVITTASITGGNLILNGFARPGSVIELFIGDGDPSGFGEGKTYLTTLTEGSGADTDATTGTYTNPVNGLNQGTDNTNKFTFSIPVPGGVSGGTKLTATATLANATSEFSGVATVAVATGISGKIFEDVNYGGGAGRTLAGSSGVARPGARVELYDPSGNFVSFTTTDASGDYSFAGMTAGNYTVRVVNSSVTSSRTGYIAGLLPVQSFRTNASSGTAADVTDRVGGETPNLADAGNGSTTLASLTTGTTTAQSITTAAVSASIVTGVDFGFSFDMIVNVNNTGQGSLRQFITNASTLTGDASLSQAGLVAAKENAVFMISNGTAAAGLRAANNYFVGGVATIAPASALPTISATLVLDAQKQPGWSSAPIIELNGAGAGSVSGLTLTAANSLIRGFVVNGFSTILAAGIKITGGSATGNTVTSNYLGTNAAGTAAIPNYNGVSIEAGAQSNTIGGTTAPERNLISGNSTYGAQINGSGTNLNVVKGNYIGTNYLGTSAIANATGTIIWAGASNNTIGGSAVGAGNVISGSSANGIIIANATSQNNIVQGNLIGTDAVGTGNLGNGGAGLHINQAAHNNTIGGTAPREANTIAFNQSNGIDMTGAGTDGNLFSGNSIFSNTSLGIDLGKNGVTLNNGTKSGAVPNQEMDTPVFTSVNLSGTTLTVAGYVGSAPNQSIFASSRVEIFKSDNDLSGYGEGQIYFGFLTSDANGNFSGSVTATGLTASDKITGTATDGSNNTSEFGSNASVGKAVSGNVFEDVNYGGGAGRTRAASSGVSRSGARVELYDAGDNFVTFTTTDGSGNYAFASLAAGNYTVRVVNSTVTSSRTGYIAGLLPVQTFRTNASTGTAVDATDFVGGETPNLADAGDGSTTLAALTTATTTAQSIAPVTVGTGNVTGVDFGFNFDTIVNVNNTGQGSLRQFLTNANALGNAGLAQSGLTAGRETSVFMISNGLAHPGLRAGLTNQLNGSGVAVITLSSLLPTLTDSGTAIDGTTQTTNVGDLNAGALGVGGTVGVDALALSTVNRPEVQLVDGAASLAVGLVINASNTTVRGLAIYGFGDLLFNNGHETIRVDAGTGLLFEGNIIGASATSFSDPGAARSGANHLWVFAGTGTIQNNLIGYGGGSGVELATGVTGWTVQNNEFRGNSQASTFNENLITFGTGHSVTGNLFADSRGSGIDLYNSTATNLIQNNTVTNNGLSNPTNENVGFHISGSGGRFEKNIVTANFGAGILVTSGSSAITISQNSIFANGTILNEGGGGPGGQIGIDLTSAGDNQARGTAPFVTINDDGDGDSGANGLLNFPVFTSASISGGNLVLKGFARPGALIELFVAAADPTGFGEGQTYLTSLTEGSGADTDAGTGTYTDPVNGLNQGTDTTNRFTFSIPLPAGVVDGTALTATATISGATSEFSGNVTAQTARTISGNVFEDLNYGGGAGRTRIAAGGSSRPGARVEIFDASGNYVSATTTDASGDYSFAGLVAGNYTVRVVNSSVTSSRAGYVPGLLPVQTFRTNASTGTTVAVTDFVGGETPNLADAGDGSTTLAALTTATTTAQSIAPVTVGAGNVTEVDFGFNFDTIVNVNNTGPGTLDQFLTNANTLSNAGLAQSGLVAGKDNAVFMISNGSAAAGLRAANNYFVGGIATIAPVGVLPTIIDPIVIDATKQTGWASAPIIELNGVGAGAGITGLTITAGTSVVRGLVINRFLHSGITLSGAGGNTIQGNYLGTSAAGTAAAQNDQQGVLISGSPSNLVGGTTAAERNVISGNRLRGMLISGAGSTGNVISGNYVGTNAAGTGAVANAVGIYFNGAGTNTIGGTATGAGNVISGNTQIGLYFVGAGATGNLAQGNIIGLDATASSPVPNGTRGIEFTVNPSNNTIGGATAGAPNIVAANGGGGVRVVTGNGNRIQRNSIYGNTTVGIDLGLDNVTGNDGAVGSGPNNGMDYPIFTSATLSGGTLTVTGYIGSAPGQVAFANATIEIFKADNTPADQNGEIIAGDGQSVAHGEGRTFLGEITADASGNFSSSFAVAGLSLGESLTATATNAGNDTSEFGANFVAAVPGVAVTGTVYSDANHNAQFDAAESGTGLTLYAKLIPAGTPSGPASQAVAVTPATGAYSLSGVSVGNYIIVIDDNNTLADVAPTLPAGWIGTERPDQTRADVVVSATPVPNLNFGLFNGSKISGTVFSDIGAGGGTANDGLKNGAEAGLANVTVRLTDNSGTITHDQTVSGGAGQYVLWAPAPSDIVKVVEVNPAAHISTGASVGTSGGTYDRTTDTISFTHTPGTSYTGLDFGDAPGNVFTTDGQQAGLPGSTVVYGHMFTAGSAGSVLFSSVSAPDPGTVTDWSHVLHRDLNANGQLDPGEPVLSGAIAVAAGETIAILVKEYIPADAPFNAQDPITVNAAFTYTGASPALGANFTRTNLTTVGESSTAGLKLLKSVDLPTALPGETLTYTITYTNNSPDILRDVVIHDTTPAFSTFLSAANGPLPASLTGVVVANPAIGAEGAISWTFTGTLAPGSTGTVSFAVKINE